MAEVFTQAHIWADEKTGRTSRMSVNKRGLDARVPEIHNTSIVHTRTLFSFELLRTEVQMSRTKPRLCVNDCLPVLNIELGR